jgi:hypothetical protein
MRFYAKCGIHCYAVDIAADNSADAVRRAHAVFRGQLGRRMKMVGAPNFDRGLLLLHENSTKRIWLRLDEWRSQREHTVTQYA